MDIFIALVEHDKEVKYLDVLMFKQECERGKFYSFRLLKI